MTTTQVREQTATDLIDEWVRALNEALQGGDWAKAASLFREDGYLRDSAILTWRLRTVHGRPEIEKMLRQSGELTKPGEFSLSTVNPAPSPVAEDGTHVVMAILDFETTHATGKAVLSLQTRPGSESQAVFLSTILQGLKKYPELSGAGRPTRTYFQPVAPSERPSGLSAKTTRETEVLIVGAGQSGLALGARLKALGVEPFLIDQWPRVGDNWRMRYGTLALHNAIWTNDLPYMEFPSTWPIYVTKDQVGAWFEMYAQAMDLEVSSSTTLVDAKYDDAAEVWTAHVSGPTGEVSEVRAKHIVMATGVSGIPKKPDIAGLDDFKGVVFHTSEYQDAAAVAAKFEKRPINVVIFGTGNSAHDVAQDLYTNGQCHVTMVQRSSTTVINLSSVRDIYDKNVYDRSVPRMSSEEEDLKILAMPYDLIVENFRTMTDVVRERDQELIDGLNAVGFRTDYGRDGTGHRMKYLRRGGGYYINVGCSELIVNGEIKILNFENFDRIVEDGVRLHDGTILPADVIVLATGFFNQQEVARGVFGDAVAEKVGNVWGFNDDGELGANAQRSRQAGLWFLSGGFPDARVNSRVLALQVKACLAGILDPQLEDAAANG